ncbi:MAG TPA: hypothetical protein VGO78_28410, partial [Acidimicrobiales bacterium]|nr:hypothetical protein [Acidimicrobiales bacterium]
MTAVLDARVPDLLDDLVRTAPPAPPPRRIAARARRLDISVGLSRVLRAIGSVTGLWITRHGLLSATPAGADIYGHVARTDFALHELFAHNRLDGWYPGLGGGYRMFTVNGPGLALLAGVVRIGTLGRADTAQAFGLLGALSIAVLPWAVALLSRELGATRMGAALHGLLALFVSFYAGGGLAGLYGPGLIAQSVGLPLQVVALALVIRAMRHGSRRTIGVAAAAVAGLALLHPISILVLALFAPLGVGREWLGAPLRRLGRGAAVALGAVALAGFWLVPAVRFRELQGDATAWLIPPLPTRLAEVARGDVLFPRPVALAVAGAAAVTLVMALLRPAHWRRLAPFAAALAFLTVAHLAVGHAVGPYDLRVQFPTRGLALTAILALHPLAGLLGDLATSARRGHPKLASEPPLEGGNDANFAGTSVVVVVATVGLAVCVPWLLRGPLDPRQEAVPVSASFRAAADELHRVVPPMGRHLLVTPPPTAQVGSDFPARWLAVASGTASAHLYFWEATRENVDGILAADLLWTIDPAAALDTLRRAGVTHVVTADPAQAAALDDVDGFRPVWTAFDVDVTIHEVLPAPGRPSPEDLLQPAAEEPLAFRLAATAVDRHPEHLAWDAETDTDLAVVAAVNYDPAW